MNKTAMNLQDLFLNQVRKENVQVTIYLVSGVQLKGLVRGFDSFTLILESPGKPAQLVYKHAMASVVPARPIGGQMGREDAAEDRPSSRPESAPNSTDR
ncbi:MAG: RNA chaperone Hfq [Armatimonadota bacterium]|jgi:host factor-I protein